MEIEALRTFVEVVRRGSFAAVARSQNVDPSSISRAIASLEQQLGVRLFQRTTRQLAPTEAAAAYFERVAPLVDELERAAVLAGDTGETPRGVLRVTAPVSFAQVNVMPLVPEFARRYPEVSFEFLLTDTNLDLVEERVDVALRLGRLAESSYVAHRLVPMTYAVCASPDYLRRRGRPKTPRDLTQHDCLRYPVQGYGPRWRFQRGDEPAFDVPIRGRVLASNGVALRQCAVGGMGVLMLPRWNVAAELRSGALVEVLTDYRATSSEYDIAAWLLFPSRAYLPRKTRAFADFLKQKFKHGAPAEKGLPKR